MSKQRHEDVVFVGFIGELAAFVRVLNPFASLKRKQTVHLKFDKGWKPCSDWDSFLWRGVEEVQLPQKQYAIDYMDIHHPTGPPTTT